ncbi:MAG: hypothetical protein E7124_07285 [Bacteroidales bacterium]|nr:hypothetical protein [Bacteroidales bacterium]
MLLHSEQRKGFHPSFNAVGKVKSAQIQGRLSAFILTEVKYLIDKAQKDIDILVSDLQQFPFLLVKVVRLTKLDNRVRNQGSSANPCVMICD